MFTNIARGPRTRLMSVMVNSRFLLADCPHPTCNAHGYCVEGTCICKKGWKGTDCSQMDKDALQCLPDCSGHGTFDLDTQTCTCEPRWSGEDCSRGKYYLKPVLKLQRCTKTMCIPYLLLTVPLRSLNCKCTLTVL